MKEKYLKIVVWFVLFVLQIGKEHVGLKAVTEILQDIQYKVSSYLKENKNTGYESGSQDHFPIWWFSQRTHRVAVILMGVVYNRGRIQTKNKGSAKVRGAESRRNRAQASSYCPTSGITRGWTKISWEWHATTRVKCDQPEKPRWAFVNGGVIRVSHVSIGSVCVTNLRYSDPIPPTPSPSQTKLSSLITLSG